MSDALTYLYQIYQSFLDLIFNQFELFPNVTVGWVGVVIIVMSMIIVSILNIPRLSRGVKNG